MELVCTSASCFGFFNKHDFATRVNYDVLVTGFHENKNKNSQMYFSGATGTYLDTISTKVMCEFFTTTLI